MAKYADPTVRGNNTRLNTLEIDAVTNTDLAPPTTTTLGTPDTPTLADLHRQPAWRAASTRADTASQHLADLTTATAARILRRVFPTAACVMVERDYHASCDCHEIVLTTIRDRHGVTLWQDPSYNDPPAAVWAPATWDAISELLSHAHRHYPLPASDETTPGHDRHGQPVAYIYDGELHRIDIDDAIRRGKAAQRRLLITARCNTLLHTMRRRHP